MIASHEAELRGARAAFARALAKTPGPIGRDAEVELSLHIEEREIALLSILLATPHGLQALIDLRDALERGDVRVDDLVRDVDRTQPTFEEAAVTLRALSALDALITVAMRGAREATATAIAAVTLTRPAMRKLTERIRALGETDDSAVALRALQRAKARFVHANVRLVASIARKPEFQDRGLDALDLVQEGTFGLMQAVDNFDWRRGFKFSTYATWWIRQALQRAVAEHSRNIRLPFGVSELLYKINRVTREHAVRHGREPSHEELAATLDLPVEKIVAALEAARLEPTSLQTPIGEDESGQLGDLIADPSAVVADDAAMQRTVADGAQSALEQLKPREQLVIRKRFGLDDGREHTLQEIAGELGLTRERIRQIELRALSKLREVFSTLAGGELADH